MSAPATVRASLARVWPARGRKRRQGASGGFAAHAKLAQQRAPAARSRRRGALETRRDRATARQGESASLAFPALHFDAREMHVMREREPLPRIKIWRREMLGEVSDESHQLAGLNARLRKRELTREEAEAELKREGYAFGQLSDSSFDPTSRSEWTPLQAIAWIATRDNDCVRDVSFEARRRTVDWTWSDAKPELWDIGTTNLSRPAGHFVRLLGKPSMEQLAETAPTAEEAKTELWTRLRAGEIQASGLAAPNAPRVEIGALEWIDLRLFHDDVVFRGERFSLGSHSFFKVLIDRSAIVSIWRGQAVSADGARTRADATPAKNKRGRPPAFDWMAIRNRCFELFDHHGDFDPSDGQWNAQARLEEALKQFCAEKCGQEPSDSSLRERLPNWREEWLSRKLKPP